MFVFDISLAAYIKVTFTQDRWRFWSLGLGGWLRTLLCFIFYL